MALASSISAATLAKALSGIDLPLSKENIIKYVNKKHHQNKPRFTI